MGPTGAVQGGMLVLKICWFLWPLLVLRSSVGFWLKMLVLSSSVLFWLEMLVLMSSVGFLPKMLVFSPF